jgi:hypothetical protein
MKVRFPPPATSALRDVAAGCGRVWAVAGSACVFLTAAWVLLPLWADRPPAAVGPAQEKATALVRQLGDRSFKVRERASRQLVEMGTAAVPALRAGCKDADPEVRRRCEAILPRAVRWESERQLYALLADKEGRPDHELPGWKRYRKEVGTDAPARRLFVDMMRAHGDLLRAAQRDPVGAAAQVASRCQTLRPGWPQAHPVPLAELAALTFVSGDAQAEPDPDTEMALCRILEERLPEQLTTAPESRCIRKLLVPYLRRCIDAGIGGAALGVALRLELKETAELAVRELREKRGTIKSTATAALALGRCGGQRHLALLEPLLEDRTELGRFGTATTTGTTELGDVALAALVRVSGQALKDYGFPAWHVTGYAWKLPGPRVAGFPSDAERNRAKARWKAWAAGHPKH